MSLKSIENEGIIKEKGAIWMKKTISVLLCLIVASFLPFYAFADNNPVIFNEDEVDVSNPYEAILPESIIAKDTGDNFYQTSEERLPLDKSGVLPSSYDSRDLNIVTPVKSQGVTGTCWAHAAISVMETYDVKNGYKTLDEANYSESHLAWFAHNTIDSNGDERAQDGQNIGMDAYEVGGHWLYVASALTNWEGLNNEQDYPLDSSDVSMNGNYDDATDRFTCTSGRILNSAETFTVDDTERVKQWIIDNGSVSVSICKADQYMSHVGNNYSYYCDTAYATNHAITIVGWDDNYSVSNFTGTNTPAANGAWLIKDSWGTRRYSQGYFWLSYEDKSIKQYIGYTTRDRSEYLNNYNYNSAFYIATINAGTKTAIQANVFTAQNNEYVSTVGFYTAQKDLSVRVYIYKNLSTSYSNPTNGTLAASFTAYAGNPGFHTLDVPGPVLISPGEKFSVCVELTSDSYVISVPVENSSIGTYVVHAKESYAKFGSSWYEMTSVGYGNTYVYASTVCAHNFVQETVPPTCTSLGHYVEYCTICNKATSDYEIPMTGHNPTEISRPSTCTQKGYIRHICSTCNTPLDYTELPLADHLPEEIPAVASTCTRHGSYGGVGCRNCGIVLIEPRELPLAEHDLNMRVYEPTCTEDGYYSYICKNCRYGYQDPIPAMGHEYVESGRQYDSGTELITDKCVRCGALEIHTESRKMNVVSAADLFSIVFNSIVRILQKKYGTGRLWIKLFNN